MRERLLVLFLAVVLDAVMGEPPAAFHPVVGIGRLARGLERRMPVSPPGRAFLAGAFLTAAVAGLAGAVGLAGESLFQRLPPVI
ncbi:MAG TPA: cobalamin biosynthesis protein, partial [Isosphaeraceae bacterium]|nr:cobalamin biosynthesis protein [Isosphaeraceae bacterium]